MQIPSSGPQTEVQWYESIWTTLTRMILCPQPRALVACQRIQPQKTCIAVIWFLHREVISSHVTSAICFISRVLRAYYEQNNRFDSIDKKLSTIKIHCYSTQQQRNRHIHPTHRGTTTATTITNDNSATRQYSDSHDIDY
ncbi:hypothetical protein AG1IA_05211 [Rhizoctonia solani AG-1 IA]|uniref:Uncharacterized protein n=1 Tax=Thanatephorus cucumeris (strain AG1-IA) TaxID=983506 RepID=L8WVI7_THACA|nr:hypothetical protein AG1IA_05211 [Rhizoctonia solani AG-1 IA]